MEQPEVLKEEKKVTHRVGEVLVLVCVFSLVTAAAPVAPMVAPRLINIVETLGVRPVSDTQGLAPIDWAHTLSMMQSMGAIVTAMIGTLGLFWVRKGLTELHVTFNSKMDKLLEVTASDAYRKGHQEGGDEAKSDFKKAEDVGAQKAAMEQTGKSITKAEGK